MDEHLTRLLLVVAGVVAAVCLVGVADDADEEVEVVEDVELLVVAALVAVVVVQKVRPLAVDEAQLDNGVAGPLSGGVALVAGAAGWPAAACAPPAREPIKVDAMLEVDREMVSLNSLRSTSLESRFAGACEGGGDRAGLAATVAGAAAETALAAGLPSLDLVALVDLALSELVLLLVDEESSWPRPLSNS